MSLTNFFKKFDNTINKFWNTVDQNKISFLVLATILLVLANIHIFFDRDLRFSAIYVMQEMVIFCSSVLSLFIFFQILFSRKLEGLIKLYAWAGFSCAIVALFKL